MSLEFITKYLCSLILLLFISSIASYAQPTGGAETTQSGDLQIASLEQAYDSQVIQILSNHFDRKKFFVDVNINAELISETYQTTGNQVVNRRPQNISMPGLPFLPEENLQVVQNPNQTPEAVVNQNTVKSLRLINLAVNIYADTSLSDIDIEFMRRVAGFAAKVDPVRGDVINITKLSIPDPQFEPTVIITNEDPTPKNLVDTFKDYIPEIILLGIFMLALIINGFFRRSSKGDTNFQQQRDNFKSDITLDGSLSSGGNLSFNGRTRDKESANDITLEFELVSENFFKQPQEVALMFEYWIDNDLKNGPANVAEVISSIDQSSLKLLHKYLDDNKYEIIRRALIELPPMSIDEKYQAAKYFNSILESEDSDIKSPKKHAKLGLFKFLSHVSDNQLTELIKTENNQSAALILDYLPQSKGAAILNTFERSRAAEIMLKMSTLHTLSYKDQSQISTDLFDKAIAVRDKEEETDYGIESILPILESLPVEEQKQYIEQLKSTGSPIGDLLEKEFFTIDQIPNLDEDTLKHGTGSIDTSTLLDALIGLSDESVEKLLAVRPKREQKLIRLELENLTDYQGNTEEAKMILVSSIRKALKLSKQD